MMIIDTTQCSNRPAAGELNGRLLAQILEKGRTPSRPNSWTTVQTSLVSTSTTHPTQQNDKRTSTLRKDDRQDISKRRQRHKHRHDLLSPSTEHVSKESSRDGLTRGKELVLGDGGKIGDIAEHVKDTDGADCHRGCDFQRTNGVPGLTQGLSHTHMGLVPCICETMRQIKLT